jgi:EAL domain-containing protein (putative c-di-GMP-specific phosphodiesterase class I)
MNLGIALYPKDGKNSATLLKNADAALYHTDKKGGNKYQFFSPTMIEKAEENIKLETLLNLAIIKGKLELLYQPEINLKTGEIIGFEAFVKWHDSALGEIPAEQFLAIAEDSGLIVPLNYWMIKSAGRQNQIWQENKLPPIKVKIKLYSPCLEDQNFLSQLTDILAETKLDPNFLDLLIQQTNLIQNWPWSRPKLRDLQTMGVTISLDDFGLGNSSLDCLRKFPFNKLEIAPTFIQNLAREPENLAIISAIISLASSFKMQVVAKGVNIVKQMKLLLNLQCEQMQGELFSPLLNAEMATDFLSGKNDTLTKIINQQT